MLKYIHKFIAPETFKNLSTLMGGTLISALIPIISSPIISRLYAPAFYGVLGLYMSITGLVGVIAYTHYVQGIMLAKDEKQAKQVIWFSLFICAIISLLSLFIILILYFFTGIITTSSVGYWYWFVPCSIFFNGITTILMMWANRVKHYRNLAYNRIIQAFLTAIVQITIGFMIKNETGLMVGLIFGQILSALLLIIEFYFKRNNVNIGKPFLSSFKGIAIEYKNLVFYSTPSEFINNFINQTPIFLLQKFAGATYVGNFAFTTRLLGLPQIFLSSAIVDVFKQKASEAYHLTGSCRLIFVKTFKLLAGLAIIPFVIIVLFAPQIFTFVFGNKWTEAGVFAQFLSIMFFLRFVVSPLTYVYFIVGKLKEDFLLHILFLFVTTVSFFITNWLTNNKSNLILCYSIAYSSVYIIYFIRSYHFSSGVNKNELSKNHI